MADFDPTVRDDTAELVAFVRARLAEDRLLARTLIAAKYYISADGSGRVSERPVNEPDPESGWHLLYDPERALREVEAKRLRLAEYETMLGGDPWQEGKHAKILLKTEALPYSAHPDYSPRWRP